jgi:hypothetical protein
MSDLRELRSYERYVMSERLAGSFASAEVLVIDIGEQGAQIEHAQPLRIATVARLWFKRGDVAVSAQALVVWSRLSKTPNAQGKLLYRSGLRIEEGAAEFAMAIQQMLERGIVQRDAESLERKRRLREERDLAKTTGPSVRVIRVDDSLPADQVLLIEHARERLRSNPEEAQKWYSRAYFAIRQGQTPLAAELTRYREDVLAVWEYLERSVPVSAIARVFDKK